MTRRNRKRSVGGEEPDPEALTPEEIDGHYAGGDFTKSRLLNEPELLDGLRRSYGEMLPAMVEGLVRVFPRDRCRAALESGTETLVLYLFDVFPQTWRVMAMAFDLATIGVDVVERTDPHLLRRLGITAEFHGAQLEVSVWANAVRAGIRVGRFKASDEKRPDLLIGVPVLVRNPATADSPAREYVSQVLVQVEIKGLASSAASRFGFSMPIWDLADLRLPPENRSALVRLRDRGRFPVRTKADRERLTNGAPTLIPAIQTTLARLADDGWPLGVHELPLPEGAPPGADLVQQVVVEVVDPSLPREGDYPVFGASLVPDLLQDADDAHTTRRALDKVTEALAQFEAAGHRLPSVFFLDLPMEVDLHRAFALIDEALRTDPAKYGLLDGVLVRARGRYPNGKEVWCGGPVQGPARRLDGPMLQALWDALTPSPHRLMGAWTDDPEDGDSGDEQPASETS